MRLCVHKPFLVKEKISPLLLKVSVQLLELPCPCQIRRVLLNEGWGDDGVRGHGKQHRHIPSLFIQVTEQTALPKGLVLVLTETEEMES